MIRATGFYWVRLTKDDAWIIAYWSTNLLQWLLPGNCMEWYDKDFFEIVETPIINEK
jgi:hypothetical protein